MTADFSLYYIVPLLYYSQWQPKNPIILSKKKRDNRMKNDNINYKKHIVMKWVKNQSAKNKCISHRVAKNSNKNKGLKFQKKLCDFAAQREINLNE